MKANSPNVITLALLIVTAFSSPAVLAQPTLTLEHVSSAFNNPVFGAVPPGEPNRMFVLEQHTGDIRILDLSTGTVNPGPFLNIAVANGGEQGLLGLAFHPGYATNGRFFVNYTDPSGNTVIEEYERDTADVADPNGTIVLGFDQPTPFHNGGWIGFGPDGYLYISSGDSDYPSNGQNTTQSLLGKILRLDIDRDDFASDPNRNYGIPSDNPFVGQTGADEVFAYGLRNPWRCSFDRLTGDLYIADVGSADREEIDVLRADRSAVHNFGWDVREGTLGGPKGPNMVDPVYEYEHGVGALEGFSVTGGYVYRGPVQSLQGHYFFTDFVTNHVWSFKLDNQVDPLDYNGRNKDQFIDWTDAITTDVGGIANLASFAEDSEGNLYTIGLGGSIFKVVDANVPDPIAVSSVSVVNGILVSGSVSELEDSDNVDMSIRRNPAQTSGVVTVDFESVSPVTFPVSFEFCLESSAFFRSTVVQSVQLYDFDSQEFVEVDARNAARFTDRDVRVDGDGDLSRFVEAGTGRVRSRAVYSSVVRRQQFSAAIDKALWIIN